MKEFWRMLGLMLLWGFINLATTVIGVIILFVRNPSAPHMNREALSEKFYSSPEFTLTTLLGALLIIVVFFGKRYVTLSPGLVERMNAWKFFGILALATISYLLIDCSIMDLPSYHNLFPEEWKNAEEDNTKFDFFSLLNFSLTGPITEEIAFRGILLGGLLRMRCRPWLAILISALAFAAMHDEGIKMLGCTGFGILCGWLFWRTRSILPGIVVHIINNSFVAVVVKSEEIFNSSEEYAPTPTIDVILILIFLPILYYSLRYLNRMIPREPAPQVLEPINASEVLEPVIDTEAKSEEV
jgi:hypothetical protein